MKTIDYTEEFYQNLSSITGINVDKLKEYGKENSILNVIERPFSFHANEEQAEKLNSLNRFISLFSLFKEQQEELVMDSSEKAKKYFEGLLSFKKDREVFVVSFLDTKNKIIETAVMAEGGINKTMVELRDILEKTLQLKAANIIVAHNHPSGDVTPSKEDRNLTKTILNAFLPLGIYVADHIVVGDQKSVSIREEGYVNFERTYGYPNFSPYQLGEGEVTDIDKTKKIIEDLMTVNHEEFFEALLSLETGIENKNVLRKTYDWFLNDVNETLINERTISQARKYEQIEKTIYVVSNQEEKEAYTQFAKKNGMQDIKVYDKKEILEKNPMDLKNVVKIVFALKAGDDFSDKEQAKIDSMIKDKQVVKHEPVTSSFKEDWEAEAGEHTFYVEESTILE